MVDKQEKLSNDFDVLRTAFNPTSFNLVTTVPDYSEVVENYLDGKLGIKEFEQRLIEIRDKEEGR